MVFIYSICFVSYFIKVYIQKERELLFASFEFLRILDYLNYSNYAQKPTPYSVSVDRLCLNS